MIIETVPCPRTRSCGHPCRNKCGEPCDKGECHLCEEEKKKRLSEMHERAKKKIKELEEKIRREGGGCKIEDIQKNSPEYLKVFDKVMKFIVPVHNWSPQIQKIQKITNLKLEKDYEEARTKTFDDFEDEKFHGTGKEGVEGIPKTGFRLPSNPGMYGKGVYFATDSSKSSRYIYTKGSNALLLCKVLLGKSLVVTKDDNTLDKNKLRSRGYDSVFAPRDTKGTGGVLHDEFVIFDPKQALPEYIIHYTNGSGFSQHVPTTITGTGFTKINMKPSRTVDMNNPRENIFRFAESHYYRQRQGSGDIKSIDIISNPLLEAAFERKQKEFKSKNVPHKFIFAYHGTNAAAIDSILRTNFDNAGRMAHGNIHGPGNYFSEFPAKSLNYSNDGKHLIFCKILPGKQFKGSASSWPGYDSKLVSPGANTES